jgi:hypothetical protein
MPEIRSVVLAANHLATGGGYAIVDGQDGLTLLVKSAYFNNLGAGTVNLTVSVYDNATAAGPILATSDVLSRATLVWEGWVVIMPNQQLNLQLSADSAVHYWVSGTALHGVETLYVPLPQARRLPESQPLPSQSPPPTTNRA